MIVYVCYETDYEHGGRETFSTPRAVFTTHEQANAWCAAGPCRDWTDLEVDAAEIGQPWETR